MSLFYKIQCLIFNRAVIEAKFYKKSENVIVKEFYMIVVRILKMLSV